MVNKELLEIRLVIKMCFFGLFFCAFTLNAKAPMVYDASVPTPTLSNISYGEHSRNILDFWKANSEVPTPVVLVIHGGGWNGGQKEMVHRFVDVQRLLDAGVSVVSINYRLMKHARAQKVNPLVKAPMYDCARALQYLRSKAGEWNIDKELVAATGGSAGACTSLWLAFHDDLADPNSKDSVLRESSRLFCAAVQRPQTTLDPQQMREWIPQVAYGAHAFGIDSFEMFLAKRDSLLPLINEYSPYALVSSDDSPVYMNYTVAPGTGKTKNDFVHSGGFGPGLQKHCAELGVACELYYPGATDYTYKTTTDYLLAAFKRAEQIDSSVEVK